MTAETMPDLLLLLYTDRSDPVASAILDHPGRCDREVVAISLHQLLHEVVVGPMWRWAGRTIDPSRTAIIHRLLTLDGVDVVREPESSFRTRQLWIWLAAELRRFAYASSLPNASSVMGDYGSLLDQWQDLPPLVGGLRVPEHRPSWSREALAGDVYVVDPRQLYSLGHPLAAGVSGAAPRLAYVRPAGMLMHVAQVGGTYLFANVPPGMTARQQEYVASFAGTMARVSVPRILEHAFFVGNELPVFYATFPVPVVTGRLGEYPDLVIQGLCDDIERRSRRTA